MDRPLTSWPQYEFKGGVGGLEGGGWIVKVDVKVSAGYCEKLARQSHKGHRKDVTKQLTCFAPKLVLLK